MDPGIILFFNNRYPGNKDPQILFHFNDEENRPIDRMSTFTNFSPQLWPSNNPNSFLLLNADPLQRALQLRPIEKLNIPDIDHFLSK